MNIPTPNRHDEVLCYRCERISLDTVCVTGGFFHSHTFEEVAESARTCPMCALIHDGLLADISDRFEDRPDVLHKDITIHLNVYQVRVPGIMESFQAALSVWSRQSSAKCLLNWYLPHNKAISSPLRPNKSEKLSFAKVWLRQRGQAARQPRLHSKLSSATDIEGTVTNAFPTRLLDLGSQGCTQSSDIRLVSYENGFRYIALSHRWGGSQHFTTTRFNVHNHKRGIRFADLPKTFQDSIVVARSLDIRYLWIDALCIIQDDENEWHGEALLMGNIYRNAECTIAVHDAPDDSAGFLEASLQSPKSVSIECAQDNTSLTVSLRSNFRAAVDRSELTRRGWVLQERYLSSRTLHFTETSIFLEDGSSVFTEEDVPSFMGTIPLPATTAPPMSTGTARRRNPPTPVDESLTYHLTQSFPSLLAADPFDSRLSPFNIGTRMHNQKYDFAWFKLLERYSATKLTYESDKLPAISGLVKLLQQDIQGRFVMGVWDTMFHKGLLWAAHLYPLMRPRHRRAPSWSWVSVEGQIQHAIGLEIFHPDDQTTQLDIDGTFKESVFIDTLCPLVLRAKKRPLELLLPAVADAETPLFFRQSANLHRMFGIRQFAPISGDSSKKIENKSRDMPTLEPIGFAVLDYELAPAELQGLCCIQVVSLHFDTWVLLVTPDPSTSDCWRRIGMGCIRHGSREMPWFQDVPVSTITLV